MHYKGGESRILYPSSQYAYLFSASLILVVSMCLRWPSTLGLLQYFRFLQCHVLPCSLFLTTLRWILHKLKLLLNSAAAGINSRTQSFRRVMPTSSIPSSIYLSDLTWTKQKVHLSALHSSSNKVWEDEMGLWPFAPHWPISVQNWILLCSASPHIIHVYTYTSCQERQPVANGGPPPSFLDETLAVLSTRGDLRKTINTRFYFETRTHGFLAISGDLRVKAA